MYVCLCIFLQNQQIDPLNADIIEIEKKVEVGPLFVLQ